MIIAIVGPTGVGKTDLSINLAKKYNGEIINADSTQIYKEINIGTAKVKDLEGITHHLLDVKSLKEDYSIFQFQTEARSLIDIIIKKDKTPIIVGGSGLYISAVLYDYKFNKEETNKDFLLPSLEQMNKELISHGIEIDINNHQRIKRSYIKYVINKEKQSTEGTNKIYKALIIGLTTDRDKLYQRINNRVHEMIEEGLEKEVITLFDKYPNSKQLRSTIGYKEFIPYLSNEILLDKVIDNIQQNSRRYAKRQFTWFNNKMEVKWFNTNYEDFNKTICEVKKYIEEKQNKNQ